MPVGQHDVELLDRFDGDRGARSDRDTSGGSPVGHDRIGRHALLPIGHVVEQHVRAHAARDVEVLREVPVEVEPHADVGFGDVGVDAFFIDSILRGLHEVELLLDQVDAR